MARHATRDSISYSVPTAIDSIIPDLTRNPTTSINMSCQPETSCSTCPDEGHHNGVSDIEDYKLELETLRKRTQDLELKISSATNGNGNDHTSEARKPLRFRSELWFNDPNNRDFVALYTDRYLNYGLTNEELNSGKPIIGIAQSGSDLAPCNRYHLTLAKRVREGIRSSGAIAFEFPTHPIQESSRRPTATLDRNLAYLGLVELLHAYPLDGVVLLTGCDKTTPAFLMAASTVVCLCLCLSFVPCLTLWAYTEYSSHLPQRRTHAQWAPWLK